MFLAGLLLSVLPTPMFESVAAAWPVKQLSASGDGDHTCVLFTNGKIRCWGMGLFGRLGNGKSVDSPEPVAVSGVSTAIQIAAGPLHTCAVLSGGTVKCWGANGNGQLGNNKTSSSSTPVTAAAVAGARQVAVGHWHTCALLASGSVKCWGFNAGGQLGNGPGQISQLTPLTVSGISGATQLAAGAHFTCAIVSGGKVKCWGYGFNQSNPLPGFVNGISGGAKQISLGREHGCATIDDGSIKCFGVGGIGQLGNGTTPNVSPAVTVTGISNAKQVAAGGVHSCAVLKTGFVRCWGGSGFGQLADGQNFYNRYTPVVSKWGSGSSDMSDMTQIAAGYAHTCALLVTYIVYCWGKGLSGQIGDGSFVTRYWPTRVSYPWDMPPIDPL